MYGGRGGKDGGKMKSEVGPGKEEVGQQSISCETPS